MTQIGPLFLKLSELSAQLLKSHVFLTAILVMRDLTKVSSQKLLILLSLSLSQSLTRVNLIDMIVLLTEFCSPLILSSSPICYI